MTGCPQTPEATKALLERIAFIQHTHYGGFWDFTTSSIPTDTAYTNKALAVHNDTTYLTQPCGLQMFHLLSHEDGDGGESLFVDGYAAAAHLQDTAPSYFDALTQTPIAYHASGNPKIGELDNLARSAEGSSVIETHSKTTTSTVRDKPMLIRWNNYDRATQHWDSNESLKKWYTAANAWSDILKKKKFEIRLQLQPGVPIIFDNWRYLHGRTAFTGKRRICGGYSEKSSPHPSSWCAFYNVFKLSKTFCCT